MTGQTILRPAPLRIVQNSVESVREKHERANRALVSDAAAGRIVAIDPRVCLGLCAAARSRLDQLLIHAVMASDATWGGFGKYFATFGDRPQHRRAVAAKTWE
jgi:hypothetical protein